MLIHNGKTYRLDMSTYSIDSRDWDSISIDQAKFVELKTIKNS